MIDSVHQSDTLTPQLLDSEPFDSLIKAQDTQTPSFHTNKSNVGDASYILLTRDGSLLTSDANCHYLGHYVVSSFG